MPNFITNYVVSSLPVHKFPNERKAGKRIPVAYFDSKYGSKTYGISYSIKAEIAASPYSER